MTDRTENRHPRGEEAKQRLRERAVILLRQIEALPADDRLNPAAYGELAEKLDDALDIDPVMARRRASGRELWG